MADRITDVSSFFSTTVAAQVTTGATAFEVVDSGDLTSPCYITINSDDPNKREIIYCDGSFGANTFVTSDIGNRALPGSAVGAPFQHEIGDPVTVTPLAQHIDDLNDRVSSHAHGGGTDGTALSHSSLTNQTADDHTQYIRTDGSRAFSGAVAGVSPTTASHLATKGYVDTRIPSGSMQMYGGSAAPSGWLLCNGAAVSRTTYADLFGVISTTFGTGDGSTTFNLPDLRDRFPVGAGTTYSPNDQGGLASVTLTSAQMPSHTHTGPSHTHSVDPPQTNTNSDSSHTHGAGTYQVLNYADVVSDAEVGGVSERMRLTGADLDKAVTGTSGAGSAHNHAVNIASFNSGSAGTGATGSTGSGNSHENRPPYIGLNFIIKT